jgi:hypothetical protein
MVVVVVVVRGGYRDRTAFEACIVDVLVVSLIDIHTRTSAMHGVGHGQVEDEEEDAAIERRVEVARP